MKVLVRISILIFFTGISSMGYSQSSLQKKSNKKIILTSSLDRLPSPQKNNTTEKTKLKQRMIYEVDKLPIFCKIEHKLAKSSKVNVMMRLGSLDYVNRLEGKN